MTIIFGNKIQNHSLFRLFILSFQAIVRNDKELREALNQSKNKLKLHTTIPEGVVISAAEMAGRPTRSQSVPPVSFEIIIFLLEREKGCY